MSGLDFLTEHPPNAGVPVERLDGRSLAQHEAYLRNSFDTPPSEELTGEIEMVIPGQPPRIVTVTDLGGLPSVDVVFVLECAGNGRSFIRPAIEGLAWGLGGASPIEVRGVRVVDLIGRLPHGAVELVMTGADKGEVYPQGEVHYQFSVPAERVNDGSALLVTEWGGEPLRKQHGGPIRFMLPGDYAMRSVKWLTRIEAVTRPFYGHFVERYRYLGDSRHEEGAPVGAVQVRSVIATPADGETVPAGPISLIGSAWSGTAPVTDVSVSIDGGRTWMPAELEPATEPLTALRWLCVVELGPGRHVVMARAMDASDATQPMEPPWNARGYANNMVHRIGLEVVQP
jgi:DMSO/TMAO reductase YedYZ molybdopterin-dependent catalytic subunit